jgi:metal-responsive CopG/Arc/MetJ family transcriptional regulator
MRTSIDLPDSLLQRVKRRLSEQRLTFRSFVIAALEQSLSEESVPFVLRDASIGELRDRTVSAEEINGALEEQRALTFEQ